MVMQRSLAEIGYQAFGKQLLRAYGLFFNFAPMEKILVVPVVYCGPEAILKEQNQRLNLVVNAL